MATPPYLWMVSGSITRTISSLCAKGIQVHYHLVVNQLKDRKEKIPKEKIPTTFSEFKPIFLCNSSYKIITKIIATIVKPLLSQIISKNQGDFHS